MMGVGGDGTYKKQDVEFTEAISGEKEKTRADIHETEKRIRDLGGAGLLSLTRAEKCGSPGQDGSCGFQSEWLYPLKDSRIFQYICGERNDPFLCWAQIFYVLVLFLTIWGTISDMRNGRTGVGLLMRLLLLGNILFYWAGKAQNRYSIGMNEVLLFLAADASGWTLHRKSKDRRTISAETCREKECVENYDRNHGCDPDNFAVQTLIYGRNVVERVFGAKYLQGRKES